MLAWASVLSPEGRDTPPRLERVRRARVQKPTVPPERLCSPRTLVVAIALGKGRYSPRTRALSKADGRAAREHGRLEMRAGSPRGTLPENLARPTRLRVAGYAEEQARRERSSSRLLVASYVTRRTQGQASAEAGAFGRNSP
jgi:hypothetical protein